VRGRKWAGSNKKKKKGLEGMNPADWSREQFESSVKTCGRNFETKIGSASRLLMKRGDVINELESEISKRGMGF